MNRSTRWARVLCGAVLCAALPGAWAEPPETPPAAQENKDLELIPAPAQQPHEQAEQPAPTTGAAQRRYLENAFTVTSHRDELLVPAPPPAPFNWQERLFLDVRQQWSPDSRVHLTYNGRLNVRAENDISAPDHENLINDLREAYLSIEPATQTYFDIGRINLKSGVALGYNPTDYFKTRAVVEPLSADPTVLREDRLGTLMLRAERIWERATLSAAFAPAVQHPSPIYTNLDLPSFDPMLDRTNAASRVLLNGTASLTHDFSPELLLYHEGSETKLGANLTEAVGQRVVAYLECSGGRRPSLIADALGFGRETGTLPMQAPQLLPGSTAKSVQSEFAIGASYTPGTSVTFNIEYHANSAGFSGADWNQWFALGRGRSAHDPVALELWYIRDYAFDQQQLIGRHALFLRADWVDAFIPKLELAGFIDADPRDGSELLQLSADYYLADKWTVGGLIIGDLGARRSDFGSLPQAGSVLVKVARYF
jgi:hypothetical protein